MSTLILRPDAVRSNPLPFAATPHVLNEDARLTPRDIRVANAILKYARTEPSCYPSNRTLAADCHCCVRTVQYALADLRDAGWLRIEQGADGRVIWITWREGGGQVDDATPCNEPRDPVQPLAGPPCNELHTPPCNGLHPKKKQGDQEERNVTNLPLPEGNAASPGMPQEPRPEPPTAPVPSGPVRPLLDELKAIPGADGPKVRSLAWRLAHHLKDVASIGFFVMVLGLVAQGLAPVERLLAAFRVADRSRGKAQKPGAIFAWTWKDWTPPPLPSTINRPVYYQAPRPPEPRLEPAPPSSPPPELMPPGVTPPEMVPPRAARPSRRTIAEETIRQWETWASQPGFYLQEHARKKLAEYREQEPAPDEP